ncbi:response regulator transcription factor [Pectinatus cerevisiiphilus]|uniref:Two-component system alkaline phosphatase synthesis response regulator PhoP n=1 Tax=Pectinatus cerevisiiphilus TaxID=86956 RepID=A0A4R3K9H9_9FIRM|nr:response regulator transcription factor [Pectinatus cerevisiiphilus]TCS79684.1 two-component system alkaline phosphatase synthesis response regulator PhoP [Pectinatus cerevisiiphilus]
MKILVVDDEAPIRELLVFNLQKNGYDTVTADNGLTALETAKDEDVALILLDIMLPQIDGFEVCRRLKQNKATSKIPIIMITAKDEEIDKVLGLELGADDYTTKPFSMRELMARIKAVLRRSNTKDQPEGELVIGPLKINFNAYTAFLNNEQLMLTPKEYDLLKLFVTNEGKAFSRDELLEKVWGYEYYGDTRTVDVHVRHLRAKLQAAPSISDGIKTVRGVGYRFTK